MPMSFIQRLSGAMVLGLSSAAVQAVPISFFCITNNNAGDCTIGETQLGVELSSFGIGSGANGGDEVLFTFTNTGPDQSTTSEIYFDDGSLLGIAGLIDADEGIGGDPNVDFSQGANPPTCQAATPSLPRLLSPLVSLPMPTTPRRPGV